MRPSPPPARAHAPAWEPSARAAAIAVACLSLAAAVLRLVRLGAVPPGLHQDEAVNAWNAWCLLQTGRDMAGAHWPVFWAHAIGDDRTTLFFYWLLPFQAIGGLGVASARAAAAVSGILCVPLAYVAGSRLFGRLAGVVAAAMLVANPWHLTSTRWAIDGSIVPMLTCGALALMLVAGLPLADGESRPRPWVALLAGLAAGIGCYGYWAVRLHLPAFLLLALALGWTRWRDAWATRAGRAAIVAFAIGLAATAGPLAVRHLTDPAIATRGAMTRLWDPGAGAPEIASRLLGRYAVHFGPRFLFVSGDSDPGSAPADSGAFEWAMLPLMLAGLAAALRAARTSAPARVLLALVLAYPAGDVVARYDGVHGFRSIPGLAALVLLAAYGAVSAWRAIATRRRTLAAVAAALVALAAWAQDAASLTRYFGEWPRRSSIAFLYHADYMEAIAWVRPRLAKADAVFWTTTGVEVPYALTLVGLHEDPARWLADAKDVRRGRGGWDEVVHYGKHWFFYGDAVRPYVQAMRASGRRVHAILVVRPHELGLANPSHVIHGPHGEELMWVIEGDL